MICGHVREVCEWGSTSDCVILTNYDFVVWLDTTLLLFYTECPRRNVPDFGRVFLRSNYTDITQSTYVQSWSVTEIMAREKCGLLEGPHTVPASWQSFPFPSLSVVSYDGNSAHAKPLNCTVLVLASGWYVAQFTTALWMVGRLVVRSC